MNIMLKAALITSGFAPLAIAVIVRPVAQAQTLPDTGECSIAWHRDLSWTVPGKGQAGINMSDGTRLQFPGGEVLRLIEACENGVIAASDAPGADNFFFGN